ncbi:MAG TPA: polysaccharide deacetylase family protein [Anaeromyxobacter sp.]|nr:polysaccharide deacetylase family protein [Anaeromyxobacter sp.]
MHGVVALLYHAVGEPADPAGDERRTVTVEELEAQLDAIAEAGGAMDPRRATTGDSGIALTFDGGERSVLLEAVPRLARRGWVGALFVTTDRLGRPGWLAPDEVKAVRAAGWLVGSCGHTGRALPDLPAAALRDELARSRERLAAILGAPPAHLAFPAGRASPRAEDEARALGFTTLWCSSAGVNAAMLPRGPLRRTAIRRGEPLDRFRRLVRGDALTHAAGRLDGAVRGAARRALGEARWEALVRPRYDAVSERLLAALERARR